MTKTTAKKIESECDFWQGIREAEQLGKLIGDYLEEQVWQFSDNSKIVFMLKNNKMIAE